VFCLAGWRREKPSRATLFCKATGKSTVQLQLNMPRWTLDPSYIPVYFGVRPSIRTRETCETTSAMENIPGIGDSKKVFVSFVKTDLLDVELSRWQCKMTKFGTGPSLGAPPNKSANHRTQSSPQIPHRIFDGNFELEAERRPAKSAIQILASTCTASMCADCPGRSVSRRTTRMSHSKKVQWNRSQIAWDHVPKMSGTIKRKVPDNVPPNNKKEIFRQQKKVI
jgi:hypothetical protein